MISGSGRSLGEGNGYPFQYSCPENPMAKGAWWAIRAMGSQRAGHNNNHTGQIPSLNNTVSLNQQVSENQGNLRSAVSQQGLYHSSKEAPRLWFAAVPYSTVNLGKMYKSRGVHLFFKNIKSGKSFRKLQHLLTPATLGKCTRGSSLKSVQAVPPGRPPRPPRLGCQVRQGFYQLSE